MAEVNKAAQWEAPPWEGKPLEQAAALLNKMSPEERAKLLLEFPADEVIAVADMLQSLSGTQE